MKNKLHRDLPWKPTCWVGGIMVRKHAQCDICFLMGLPSERCDTNVHFASCGAQQLEDFEDDSAAKYAAVKATAAILRAMRK